MHVLVHENSFQIFQYSILEYNKNNLQQMLLDVSCGHLIVSGNNIRSRAKSGNCRWRWITALTLMLNNGGTWIASYVARSVEEGAVF